MKLFSITISNLVLRFYLMMGLVIGSIFAGVPWLAILALPVFLSAMLGVKINRISPQVKRAIPQTAQKRISQPVAVHKPWHAQI